jgi:site-specific DNA-methyltransferase (adenine-specific)
MDVLRRLPGGAGCDLLLTDPMFGTSRKGKQVTYSHGKEPFDGSPDSYWRYHRPYYEECLRVLRPGGALAWATGHKWFADGGKLRPRTEWFGGHTLWALSLWFGGQIKAHGHIWVVQTREQQGIRFPHAHAMIVGGAKGHVAQLHPCAKSIPEMEFLVRYLSRRGETVLDPFCGTGTTCIAAARLGRHFIGLEKCPMYAMLARWQSEKAFDRRWAEVKVQESSKNVPEMGA